MCGLLVYGDKNSVPNRIGALPALLGSTEVYLSDLRSDAAWWTGVAVVNPNGTAANAIMEVYAPDGSQINTIPMAIDPNAKATGYFASSPATSVQGWIRVSSDVPVAGMEILSADDVVSPAWGMAAIEGQPSGNELFFGHYTVTSRWWTILAMANLSGTSSAAVQLRAYGNGGSLSGVSVKTVPAQGRLSGFILKLLEP